MNDFSDLVLTFTSEELSEHDKQIREDAIDECIKAIKKYWHFWNIGVIARVIEVLEQTKDNLCDSQN